MKTSHSHCASGLLLIRLPLLFGLMDHSCQSRSISNGPPGPFLHHYNHVFGDVVIDHNIDMYYVDSLSWETWYSTKGCGITWDSRLLDSYFRPEMP